MPEKKDFFISYNHNNENWAKWISGTLEDHGYSTIIQAWDFKPGNNFIHEMQKATENCDRVILVVSQAYFESDFTSPEWEAFFLKDPKGEARKVIPILVEKVRVSGMLASIIHINFWGKEEQECVDALINGISDVKPRVKPPFPGGTNKGVAKDRKKRFDTEAKGVFTYFGKYPQTIANIAHPENLIDNGDGYFFDPETREQYFRVDKVCKASNMHRIKYSDGSPILKAATNYFRVEKIKWRILKREDDYSLMLSDSILDWKHYLNHDFVEQHGNMCLNTNGVHPDSIRANNWEFSTLREWLNREFIKLAFTREEREQIISDFVDNSPVTGCIEEQSEQEKYQCNNTIETAFILSYQDVLNSEYGFNPDFQVKDPHRLANVTDFAIARGVKASAKNGRIVGWWWLRSPADYRKYYAYVGHNPINYSFDSDDKILQAKLCAQLRVCDVMNDGHVCARGSIVDGASFMEDIEETCDGTANGVRVAIRVRNSYLDRL